MTGINENGLLRRRQALSFENVKTQSAVARHNLVRIDTLAVPGEIGRAHV